MENTATNLKKVRGAKYEEEPERAEIAARHERKTKDKIKKLLELRNRQKRVEEHWMQKERHLKDLENLES